MLQGHPYDCFPQGLMDVYICVSMYPYSSMHIFKEVVPFKGGGGVGGVLGQLMGVTRKRTYAPATDQHEEGWLLACSLRRNWNYNSCSI